MFAFLFVLLLICSFKVSAKVITLEKAAVIADFFWDQRSYKSNNRSFNKKVVFSWDDSALKILTKSTGLQEKHFYVFESTDNKGFVIVSADDCVMPILGYSFEDAAPKPDNLPEPMIDWMQGISEQISFARSNNISGYNNIEQMWTRISAGNVILEMETAKWNQHGPYNNQCPYDGTERSIAGCVPVAVAIVMRYHKWPKQATGITEGYYTDTKGIYVEPRDLNHKYNWDKMPLRYIYDYSEEEATEVSTLIADIGAAFQADYTKESTSSITDINALYEHFGYNPGMTYVARESYSDDIWLQMIKDELNSLRPVLYSGRSENNGGHEFVIDGYTDDDYFHINWGWGGNSNGYFTLSTLVPDDRGGYNDGQWACFNLKPCTSSEVEDWIKITSPGIVIYETSFQQNRDFYVNELYFANNTAVDFSGSFRGAITDREGRIKEWITTEMDYTLPSNMYVRFRNVWAKITQPIEIGDRIRFFYKSQNSDTWNLIKSTNEKDCNWEILIADEYNISECTSFAFDKTKEIIMLETKKGVEVRMLTSNDEDVTNLLSIKDNIIEIKTKELQNDTYKLMLSKGSDIKTLEFSIKSN